MKIIYINNFDELKSELNKLQNLEKCNFLSYVCGEFGYVSVNILLLINQYIQYSYNNSFKCYSFCIEGQEVLYKGMNLDTLFVLLINKEKNLEFKKNINKDLKIIKCGDEIKINNISEVEKYLFDFEEYLNNNNYEKMIREINFNDIFLTLKNNKNIKNKYDMYNINTKNFIITEKNFSLKINYSIVPEFIHLYKDFLIKNLYIPKNKYVNQKHISIILRNSYKWKHRDIDVNKVNKIIHKYNSNNYKIIIIQDIINTDLPELQNIINIKLSYLNFTYLFDIIGHSEIIYGSYSGLIETCIYKLDTNIAFLCKPELLYKEQNKLKKLMTSWSKFQGYKNKKFYNL